MDKQNLIASLFVVLFILLATGQTLVYNLPLWTDIQKVTTPLEEASTISQEVHSYLTDSTINKQPTITGFTQKENSHMYDVKRVFDGLQLLLFLSLIAWLALCLWTKQWWPSIFLGSCTAMGVLLLLLIIPFDMLFTLFHKVLFPQGNWIFSSGLMIKAYPGYFFYWMAQLWWIRAFTASIILCTISYLLQRKRQ